jgi:hypothetical protein
MRIFYYLNPTQRRIVLKIQPRYGPADQSPAFHHVCWIFLLFLSLQGRAKDEAMVRSLLDERDLKKVQKADQYKEKADALNEEANQLCQQVFVVQADSI